MNPHAGITRCIQCGDLVIHPGGKRATPLDVLDPSSPHLCPTPSRRPRKTHRPPGEAIERTYTRIMGNIGREVLE